MKKILVVAGARPNFMKIAPLMRAALKRPNELKLKLVHTGQHFDHAMSDVFFQELGIPEPDFHLNVGPGTQTEQMARIMIAFEQICLTEKPFGVIVVGDVTSTIATALVAKRLDIKVFHVEAGLRSGDMGMPEEVNRVLTDSISDLLFVTEESGIQNLKKEGVDDTKVQFVGHVMVDTLFYQRSKLKDADPGTWVSPALKSKLKEYAVVTFHRPSNVDDADVLKNLVECLNTLSQRIPIVFPIHPRTSGNLKKFGLGLNPSVIQTPPMSYMDFLNLWQDAKFVMTDSGGLQEETTAIGVPCLTARPSTERPVTVTEGTNTVVGTDTKTILAAAFNIIENGGKRGQRPRFWDGSASERIIDIVIQQ